MYEKMNVIMPKVLKQETFINCKICNEITERLNEYANKLIPKELKRKNKRIYNILNISDYGSIHN